MRAIINIKYTKNPILASETYETLKKRIYSADSFMDVSTNRRKIILNKNIIISIKSVNPEIEEKKKAK